MSALVLLPIAFASPIVCLLLVSIIEWGKEKPLHIAILIGLCVAVAVHGMRWTGDSDIVRAISYLQSYVGISFLDCFDAGHYTSLFVWDIWNWTVGLFGDPYLLQASAAFVGYAIIAYIVLDSLILCGAGKAQRICLMLFVVSAIPMMGVFNGIRSTCACLLVALAIYLRESHNGGLLRVVVIALAACLIHQVALLPVLLYFLAIVVKKKPVVATGTVGLAFLFAAIIGNYAVPILASSGNAVLGFLGSALSSFLVYANGDEWSIAHAATYSARAEAVLSIALLVIVLFACYRRFKVDGKASNTVVFIAFLCSSTLALMIVLPANGGRMIPAIVVLAAVYIFAFYRDLALAGKRAFSVLLAVLGMCFFTIHAYALVYGVADPAGMVLPPLFFGIFSDFV